MQAIKQRETVFEMGERKKKDFFSIETLVLRHQQEIANLTVSRLHVSHASRVLCGFSAGLLIYRFEALKVEMLSIQINTMAMLLSEFDFLPIYRADLAGSRTLFFATCYY